MFGNDLQSVRYDLVTVGQDLPAEQPTPPTTLTEHMNTIIIFFGRSFRLSILLM
jgi:hypothetical protein